MKYTLSTCKWQFASLLLICQTLAFGQPGSLNKSFGTNGYSFSLIKDQNNIQASTYNVLINENADTYSIITLGGTTLVYKRDGDGLPAPNYGDGGFSDHFSFGEKANCLLPDGSVLFAGFLGIHPNFEEQDIPGNLVLGKLDKNGKWDQHFGRNGLKTLFQMENSMQTIGLGVLANGRILVVLRDYKYQANKLFLVTLLPSGDIDHSLPNNGQLLLPFGEAGETINLPAFLQQPDKKWLLGVTESPTGIGDVQNYLVRLDADGKPDAGFGSGGIQNLDSWLIPENMVAVGCKKEGGYTLLTSNNSGNDFKLRISHFTVAGQPDIANGGVSADPVNLPFTAVLRAAVFDEFNRFSLLVAEEPVNWLNHFLVRLDAYGKPDLRFNQVGYAAIQQFPNTLYTGLALTPKKNLMVLGNSYDSPYSFLLQKILAKGQPDPFYDQDGAVTVSYPYSILSWTNLFKINDRKMLAGGSIRKNGKNYWLIEAVDEEGKRAPGFGIDGSVFVPLPADTRFVNMELTDEQQIFIYGNTNATTGDKLFLFKLFGDGRRDYGWAQNGQKILTTGRVVNSIQLKTQKDGKILVSYGFFVNDGTNNGSDISIQRLQSNGEPDNSFGYSGSRLIDVGQNFDYIKILRLQKDGKILLINETLLEENANLSVIRLLPDGKYDPSYLQGIKTFPVPTVGFNAHSVLLGEDNKLLIAGNQHVHYYYSSAGLLKLNANGSIDNSFAANGLYTNSFSANQAEAMDINRQHDGKLLLTCHDFANYTGEIINIRLYPNGQVDGSFGINGQSQYSYSTGMEQVNQARVFPGQLVMAGYSDGPLSRGMMMSIRLDNSYQNHFDHPWVSSIYVYPNPANDQLTIQWRMKANYSPKTIQLYDIDGKLLQTWQAQTNSKEMVQQQLRLNNHAAGNYLLQIIFADGSTKQEKIVIIK